MEAAEHYPLSGWRHDWATISLWLFELQDDHSHNLPGWFISVSMWTALFVIDPIIDLSCGIFPSSWTSSWPIRFVDRWHIRHNSTPAPYGWSAFKAWLTIKLSVLGNVNSIMLLQK